MSYAVALAGKPHHFHIKYFSHRDHGSGHTLFPRRILPLPGVRQQELSPGSSTEQNTVFLLIILAKYCPKERLRCLLLEQRKDNLCIDQVPVWMWRDGTQALPSAVPCLSTGGGCPGAVRQLSPLGQVSAVNCRQSGEAGERQRRLRWQQQNRRGCRVGAGRAISSPSLVGTGE